jgi:serine/threonine-protein kinase
VRELCGQLRQDGFDPWLDEQQLLPGQDWDLEVANAVKTSDAVIVCLSQASVSKVGYVQKEIRRILEAAEYRPEGRTFVIPVRLEDCPLPNRLAQWQSADLFVSGGYERLREGLQTGSDKDGNAINGAPAPAAGALPSKTSRNRRGILAGFAIIAVAAGGSLIAVYFRNLNRAPDTASGITPVTQEQETVPPGMIRIPGGRFLMGRNGSPDAVSAPAHEVSVQPFDLDLEPVTNAGFQAFATSAKLATTWAPAGGANWPATQVSWDDAESYCLAAKKRLPTEAEWEFAARGTDGRLYPWGEGFQADAVNFSGTNIGHPEPVGSRKTNRSPLGVLDMSGNVWEWCSDEYQPYSGAAAAFRIPNGAKTIRGGSYQSDALHVSAVTRNLEIPSRRSPAIGFRCAK